MVNMWSCYLFTYKLSYIGVQKVTAVETSPPSTPEVVSLSVLEGDQRF